MSFYYTALIFWRKYGNSIIWGKKLKTNLWKSMWTNEYLVTDILQNICFQQKKETHKTWRRVNAERVFRCFRVLQKHICDVSYSFHLISRLWLCRSALFISLKMVSSVWGFSLSNSLTSCLIITQSLEHQNESLNSHY